MIEPAFGSGITLVAGPEQVPLDLVLNRVCAAGVPVLVAARGAPVGRPDADLVWLSEPADPKAIANWVAEQEGPCALVLAGAASLGGWLAGERPELRLVRLLASLRPAADLTVVALEPLPPVSIRLPDPAMARLLAVVDRTLLWTGNELLRAREVLAPGAPRRVDLPADTFVGNGGFWAGVAALCALAVAVVGWAAGAGGSVLLGSARDLLPRSLWVDAWFSHQVAVGGSLRFADTVAWPLGADVLPHIGGLGAAAMALPLVRALGYPGFWNPTVGLALVCNGLAVAWLARVTGADRGGAAVAALAFAVAPPVLTAVGLGDQSVFWAAPLVVAIGLGLRALDGNRGDALRAGIAVGIAGMFWWFYALFALAVVGAMGLLRARQDPQGRAALGARLGVAVRAALPFTVGLLPMLGAWVRGDWPRITGMPGVALSAAGVAARVSFHHATTDVLPLDQLVAFPESGTGWVASAGVIAVAVGWLALWRGRRSFWVGLVVVSAVLALGPWLDPRWGMSSGWLPLPLQGISELFPPLELLDRPNRLLILTALATAILVGSLWRTVRLRVPRSLRGASWALALGLIGVGAGGTHISTFSFVPPGWIRALEGEGAVLHVPLALSEADLMWQPLHGHPIAGGLDEASLLGDGTPYRLAFEENPALAFFWDFVKGRMDPQSRAWLIAHGARYVVVYQDVVNRVSDGTVEGIYLTPLADRIDQDLGPAIYDADGVRVYRIDEKKSAEAVKALN